MLSIKLFNAPIVSIGCWKQLAKLFPTTLTNDITSRLEDLPQPICCSVYSAPKSIQDVGVHVRYSTAKSLSNILLLNLIKICNSLPETFAKETIAKFLNDMSKYINISSFSEDLEQFVLACNQSTGPRIYQYIHNDSYIYDSLCNELDKIQVPFDTTFADSEEFIKYFDLSPSRRLFLKEVQFTVCSEKVFSIGVTPVPADLVYYFSVAKTSADLISGIDNNSFISLALTNILSFLDLDKCQTPENLLFETSLLEHSYFSHINTNCYVPVMHAIFNYAMEHDCSNNVNFNCIMQRVKEVAFNAKSTAERLLL